jgi:hypothetical protein
MHNLPNLLLWSASFSGLIFLAAKKTQVAAFIKDFVTIGEDHWTWITRDGEWYEDAEIEDIRAGELVLKHRFGTCRVAIDNLTDKSRQLLFCTRIWNEHVAAGPAQGMIMPFPTPSFQDSRAAYSR